MDIDPKAVEKQITSSGSVLVLPTDTVYGLACSATDAAAIKRIYQLKGRSLSKPSAVMFFNLKAAGELLNGLGEKTLQAAKALLPGPVTLLLPNPRSLYPDICGDDIGSIGLRVPQLEGILHPLAQIDLPVMQSSANLSGGSDPSSLEEVPKEVLEAVDLAVDAGVLTPRPSTVIDLRGYEQDGSWQVVREGALPVSEVEGVLS